MIMNCKYDLSKRFVFKIFGWRDAEHFLEGAAFDKSDSCVMSRIASSNRPHC